MVETRSFFFKDSDGQTPLPYEMQKGLKIKTIQNMGELDEHEEANIAKGLSWLARQKSDPKTYDFWIKLHKKLFEDVWTWAGKIRQHELQNPDFLLPQDIWTGLKHLQEDLKAWIELNSYPPKEIAARFHVGIETVHPFVNGNGRFGRILTDQICKFQSFDVPTWGKSLASQPKERRKAYIDSLTYARRKRDFTQIISMMYS
jgi:Fic-DOC domain mobile mystery protein B